MDTNSILLAVQDKIPKDIQSRQMLQDRLDKLSDSQRNELVQKLPLLKLKSPALVFWVGSFLFGVFGVGRFYKGKGVDIALGIAFIIGVCVVCAMLGYGLFSESEVIPIVSCVLVVIYTIAVYVDSYFVYRGIQSDNLLRLQEYLFFSKHNDKIRTRNE